MESLMNATVGQLIGGGLGIIAILSVFIEFTPIKLNPVSAFLNWIGRRTNRELFEKIGDLENKVDEIQSRQEAAEAIEEEREAVNCRIRILSFSDELRRISGTRRKVLTRCYPILTIMRNTVMHIQTSKTTKRSQRKRESKPHTKAAWIRMIFCKQ